MSPAERTDRDPWDHPATAAAWQRFGAVSDRYGRVNAALVAQAGLQPGLRVLDVGAGSGDTARAVLPALGAGGAVCCVEPADAMWALAGKLGRDPRVRRRRSLPDDRYDRVLCGASVWLLGPLDQALSTLADRVGPGGALCFAIPAAYLGEEDPPGGGPDPRLTALPRALVTDRPRAPAAGEPLPDAAGIDAHLASLGLRAEGWEVETRWTSEAQAAWLALPPVGGAMRPELAPSDVGQAVAAAAADLPGSSWRPERWRGWTAWR